MGFVLIWKLFTLVSNMQILRFSLIIYNSHNWEASYSWISPDEIISSRGLNCWSVFLIYSCIYLICCSFVSLDGFTLSTYDGTDLGSPEGSTEVTTGDNLEGLFLGDWIGLIYWINIGTTVGNNLGLSDGEVIDTTLRALGSLSLVTYYGKVLRSLEV